MIATVARTALSALVLSVFTFLSPTAPVPQFATWTLQVDVSPASVEVGDSISARVTVLRDGLPGRMGLIQSRATVETANGTAQDVDNPILLPPAPVTGEFTSMPDPWLLTWTAEQDGKVRIHVTANGEVAEVAEDGSIFYHFTNAEGRSAEVTVGRPSDPEPVSNSRPVTIPEPVTLVLFGAGMFGLSALLVARNRRR